MTKTERVTRKHIAVGDMILSGDRWSKVERIETVPGGLKFWLADGRGVNALHGNAKWERVIRFVEPATSDPEWWTEAERATVQDFRESR